MHTQVLVPALPILWSLGGVAAQTPTTFFTSYSTTGTSDDTAFPTSITPGFPAVCTIVAEPIRGSCSQLGVIERPNTAAARRCEAHGCTVRVVEPATGFALCSGTPSRAYCEQETSVGLFLCRPAEVCTCEPGWELVGNTCQELSKRAAPCSPDDPLYDPVRRKCLHVGPLIRTAVAGHTGLDVGKWPAWMTRVPPTSMWPWAKPKHTQLAAPFVKPRRAGAWEVGENPEPTDPVWPELEIPTSILGHENPEPTDPLPPDDVVPPYTLGGQVPEPTDPVQPEV